MTKQVLFNLNNNLAAPLGEDSVFIAGLLRGGRSGGGRGGGRTASQCRTPRNRREQDVLLCHELPVDRMDRAAAMLSGAHHRISKHQIHIHRYFVHPN